MRGQPWAADQPSRVRNGCLPEMGTARPMRGMSPRLHPLLPILLPILHPGIVPVPGAVARVPVAGEPDRSIELSDLKGGPPCL